jgi:hypothetical protein
MPVSKFGTWPLYKLLYANGGAAMGWIDFNGRLASATVGWFKPVRPGAFYPGGFTTALSLMGNKYIAPTAGGPSPAGSWHVTLSGGNLTNSIVKAVTLNALGAGTVQLPNLEKLTLKVAPATGAASGNFLNLATKRTIAFKGLLLQSPDNVMGGVFSGTNRTGAVTIEPGL